MTTAFTYQFVANLHLFSETRFVPAWLRELQKGKDSGDLLKLKSEFAEELQNCSLQTAQDVSFFCFLVRECLLLHINERQVSNFEDTLELLRHRAPALRKYSEEDFSKLSGIIDFTEAAFQRLLRHDSLEDFDQAIDELDWEAFGDEDIRFHSSVIGWVYLNEDREDIASRARLWLYKATSVSEAEHLLLPLLLNAEFYLKSAQKTTIEKVDQIIVQLKEAKVEVEMAQLFGFAAYELSLRLLPLRLKLEDAEEISTKHLKLQIKTLKDRFEAQKKAGLPLFTERKCQWALGEIAGYLAFYEPDFEHKAELMLFCLGALQDSADAALGQNAEAEAMTYLLRRLHLASLAGMTAVEKDAKEVIDYYQSQQDAPGLIEALEVYIELQSVAGLSPDILDLVYDNFKNGLKDINKGGFYLLIESIILANGIFEVEKNKSGVSWMVDSLEYHFEQLKTILDFTDRHLEEIGKERVDRLKRALMDFEPFSHFNIRTYIAYQLFSIKLLRLGNRASDDELGVELADRLIKGLENQNNPLSFIQADWDEFKDVPNDVRNKTLNKCIDINKGDLPASAKHLSDFSYRNLRSYITLNEVNRLGFFLDQQTTKNKQLEQGIRWMLFDLYKKGTIFEIVFDMPAFLIKHAKSGFYSQDMEEALNIKGTTAKKYIKIMTDLGLISQPQQSQGRKHYYELEVKTVMRRLGQESED